MKKLPFTGSGVAIVTPFTEKNEINYDELEKLIKQVEKKMKQAAAELDFETAASLRDHMLELRKNLNSFT